MNRPLPLSTVLAMALDRMDALCSPPPTQDASPVLAGAVPQDWAEAIGIDPHVPHESIRGRFPSPMEAGGHDPSDIAYTACQRLVMRGVLDRVGGLPIRYRARAPLLRRRR